MNLLAKVSPKQTWADREFPKIYDFLAKEGIKQETMITTITINPEHLQPTVTSVEKCEPSLMWEQTLSNAAKWDDGCMEKVTQQ